MSQPDLGHEKGSITGIVTGQTKPTKHEIGQKVLETVKLGEAIPAFSPDRQQQLRAHLATSEARLNALFTAIPKDRKTIAPAVQFLPSPVFFEKAILQDGREIPDDPKQQFDALTSLWYELFDTRGLRSSDGKLVMVHTTVYDPNKNPRQMTEKEALIIAHHEMTHGKVEPKLHSISPSLEERRTGCKIITREHGEIVKVQHGSLYEAQTDALAIIGAHPEVTSWEQVFDIYLQEHKDEIDNSYAFSLSALTRIMNFAFPDFMTGLTVLGESYFRSDSEGFFQAIQRAVEAKHNPEIDQQFRLFFAYSETNHPRLMTGAVTSMIDIDKPKQ